MAAWIISTAQQANPKVRGHKEPALAQEIIEKILEEIHSSFISRTRVHLTKTFLKTFWYT